MFDKINAQKAAVNEALLLLINDFDREYSLSTNSPLIIKSIKEYCLREAKRLRSLLFINAYSAYCKADNKVLDQNIYKAAAVLELCQCFILIHDDIIDEAKIRRGKESLHNKLRSIKNSHETGKSIALVLGDIIYTYAIKSFLKTSPHPSTVLNVLEILLGSAIYTGVGEVNELLIANSQLSGIDKSRIIEVMNLKTSEYSFTAPLLIAADFAGVKDKLELNTLREAGKNLGIAFQINDDILNTLPCNIKPGKDQHADIRAGKATLLIWHTYNKSDQARKKEIQEIMDKKEKTEDDIARIYASYKATNTIEFAEKEKIKYLNQAMAGINKLQIKKTLTEFIYQTSFYNNDIKK
ncbi:MAG: polyprenyl synthetase family protein [bacterium]|nr:polyprenyl synthetase family protein [bacterium]